MVKFGPAALLVVGLLVALPGVASAKTATNVKIQAQEGGFFGYVSTKNGTCESGRKVTLYRQKGSTRNRSRDSKIGTDTAQPNGPDSMWSINTSRTGKFYAYVSSTSRCASAYSRTVNSK